MSVENSVLNRQKSTSSHAGVSFKDDMSVSDLSKPNSNLAATAKSQSKNAVPVHDVMIAGLPLKIRSSHDEQTVKELVNYVDRRINEALKLTRSGSVQAAAMLACLNISEELVLLKRLAGSEIDRLDLRLEKAIEVLESSRSSS